jgi:hypothetical protein
VVDTNWVERFTDSLETAAKRWYTSSLMSIAWQAWQLLSTDQNTTSPTDNCITYLSQDTGDYTPFDEESGNGELGVPSTSVRPSWRSAEEAPSTIQSSRAAFLCRTPRSSIPSSNP